VSRQGLDGLVWARQLQNGDIGVLLWNRFSGTDTLSVQWEDIWLSSNQKVSVRDLYAHKDLGQHTQNMSFPVASHDCVALRLSI
jgi:alpha-galactosidase